MNYPINIKDIKVNTEYYKEVVKAYNEAVAYLKRLDWCKGIKGTVLYTNLGSILCIFVFEIDNAASSEDDLIWVIVGDLPSMYLDTYGPKTTVQVLEDYTRLATNWIEHVKTGGSLHNCYPFETKPTIKMAAALEKRVSFIRTTLINNIENIPISTI